MPNVTAARPIVSIPNTSSSHGPNVTNSDWAAAINPNIPRIASHPPRARWPVGADTAMCCRGGSDPTRTNSSTPATSTPTDPATYAPRHDVSAVTTPSELTPISRPNAHDVSMIPTTRPRRSYGTWSAVHAINPMSNTILVMARTRSPSREPDDARAPTGDRRAGGHAEHPAGHRHTPRDAVDQPTDERRRQPRRLGDGERDPDVGDVDVESTGDRGDERWCVPIDRVGGEAGEREHRHHTPDLVRVGVVEDPFEHDGSTLLIVRPGGGLACPRAISVPRASRRCSQNLAERCQPGVDAAQRRGVEPVVAAGAVGAHADEPGIPEDPQVLRHGGLGDPELVLHDPRDRARRQLVVDEELQDATSHRVAEDVEGVHQPPV